MSWIVQNLLNSKVRIHSVGDIDSDEFNDLMVIEKAISDLSQTGTLSDQDLLIINSASEGGFASRVSKSIGINRNTLSKSYNKICERIAFYLGGYFTDEGYLGYMKKKYKLSDEQVEELRDFMKSKFKYKLMKSRKKHDYK